jgi:phospholipid/cholesterol/gamma-HCH transport system substrate-binding protein
MNTSVTRSLLVGVLVLVAAILAVWCYSFFNQRLHAGHTYGLTILFDDAQGIGKQADVYLAGVNIGTVTSVGLSPATGKAEVRVQITKSARVPKGSVPTITASLLGGSASVDFTPPPQNGPLPPDAYYPPGSVLTGNSSLNFAAIQAQAGGLMSQFSQTAKKANALLDQATKTAAALNQIVTDPRIRGSLTDTVENLDRASEQGLELTNELRSMLAQDNGQVQAALGNVTQTTGALRQTTQQNKNQINQIVENLNQTTSQLARLTTQANQTFAKGDTLQNLSDTIAGLKQASIKMNEIEANISSFTGDKQVQVDIKQTIHNTALVSQDLGALIPRLKAIVGKGGPSSVARGNAQFMSTLDFTQDFRTNKFRTDFNLYAPISATDFARLGVYDLTGLNKLNLQYGQVSPYNKLLTYRAGIYASEVGIGADYDLFGDRTFSLDIYNPNRIQVDARQKFRLNKESSLWLGVQDVPRTNAITLGFELQH